MLMEADVLAADIEPGRPNLCLKIFKLSGRRETGLLGMKGCSA
jgi:hypothetical protein